MLNMCGRYTLVKTEKLKDRFNLAKTVPDMHANYNVAPGQQMPVITVDENGTTKAEVMKWGLIPFWAKDPKVGYRMINARSESLFDKPTWKKLIARKRCLVPADGFYEWKKINGDKKTHKQPLYIHPKQTDLFSFAGLWETWKDVEGLEWKTYSIITTDANKEMSGVHDRMPVILHKEDESSWLSPSLDNKEDIEHFLRPYDDNGLEMYEVSDEVNSPKNNRAELLTALK